MQEFSNSVFMAAIAAIMTKREIEFQLPRELTAFSEDPSPTDWQPLAPAALSQKEYDEIITMAARDGLKGGLMILEIKAYQAGGRIFYRGVDKAKVGVRITWP